MFRLLLIYLPSFLGLVIVNHQMWKLLQVARGKKSIAQPMLAGLFASTIGVMVSWFVVLQIALQLLSFGVSLISWQVSLLPVGWAIVLIYVNRQIRK